MEPEIVIKDAFKVVGTSCNASENMKEKIDRLWRTFEPRIEEVKARAPGVNYFGIGEMGCGEEKDFIYMAGVKVTDFKDIPEGMEAREVPSQQYAHFTHKGLGSTVPKFFDYIYGTWLPGSNYEVVGNTFFEYYDERATCPDDPENIMQFYIPIKPK